MKQDEVIQPATTTDMPLSNRESSGILHWTARVIEDTWGMGNALVCPHRLYTGQPYDTDVPRAVIGLGESAILAPIANIEGLTDFANPKDGLENVISASTLFVHGLYDIAGGPDCTTARIVL